MSAILPTPRPDQELRDIVQELIVDWGGSDAPAKDVIDHLIRDLEDAGVIL